MSKLIMMCAAVVCLIGSFQSTKAQERSAELVEATRAIDRFMQEKMPEWKRTPVTPMTARGAADGQVAIDFWSYGGLTVKVSIVKHSSEERASGQLNEYPDEKGKGMVEVIGDEAFMLNDGLVLAFRKRDLTVYIAEIEEGLASKDSSIIKKFAHHVAAALKRPTDQVGRVTTTTP